MVIIVFNHQEICTVLNFFQLFLGRFDLSATIITCSNCNYSKELMEIDYLHSRWWPGAVTGSSYLFSESLLEFWWNLNHQYLGASTNKFIATLNRMSIAAGRVKETDYFHFNLFTFRYKFYLHFRMTQLM